MMGVPVQYTHHHLLCTPVSKSGWRQFGELCMESSCRIALRTRDTEVALMMWYSKFHLMGANYVHGVCGEAKIMR